MKILITGRGSSGSFQIRGRQLGAAIGATVEPRCADPRGFDLAIVVKRPPMDLIARLHQHRIPVVWDVVDAWPQPHGNDWSEAQCKNWLAVQIVSIKPVAIVAATQAMARDCEVFGVPVLWLPHHARPGMAVNPIRERVLRVGYEGGPNYIRDWRPVIEQACADRGWTFHAETESLADVDIVLALRDQHGYAPRHWKSGVKAANAMGSGTPIICSHEAGYFENASGGEYWAGSVGELHAAMDALASQITRRGVSEMLLAKAPMLDDVAAVYRKWLGGLQC